LRIAPRCWFPKDHDGEFPVDRSRRELRRPRADLQPPSRQGRGWRGTPIGLLPALGEEGIDTEGLGVTPEAIANLVEVDVEDWKQQLPQMHGASCEIRRVPAELYASLAQLDERLQTE
jgi:GTP-dependent phosphoenolpyruvate carboxykinase